MVFNESTKEAFKYSSHAEKVAFITAALEERFKGAAAAARDTAAGAMKAYGNALGDLDEQLGSVIDKPLAAAYNAMENAVVAVTDALASLSPEFKAIIGGIVVTVASAAGLAATLAGLGASVAAVTAAWPLLTGAFSGGLKAIKNAGTAIGSLAKAFVPVLIKVVIVAAAFAGIILIIGVVKRAWDENLFGIKETTATVFNWLGKAYDKVADWTSKWADKITGFMGEVKEAFIKAFEWAKKALTGEEVTVKREGPELFRGKDAPEQTGVLDELKKTAKAGVDVIAPVGKAIGELGKKIKNFILVATDQTDAVEDATDKIKDAIDDILTGDDQRVALKASREARQQRARELLKQHLADQEQYQKDLKRKRLSELDVYADIKEDLSAAGAEIRNELLQISGEVGNLIKAGMQGMAAGGPIGAIVAVIMELVSKFRSVLRAVDLMDDGVKMLADTLSPMFDGLVGMHKMVNESLGSLMDILGKQGGAVEQLGRIFNVLFEQIGYITEATNSVIGILAEVLGPVLQVFAEVTEKVSWLFNKGLEGLNLAFDEIKKGLGGFMKVVRDVLAFFGIQTRLTPEQLNAQNQAMMQAMELQIGIAEAAAAAQRDLTKETETLRDTTEKANQALGNMPSGYKLVGALLESIADVNPDRWQELTNPMPSDFPQIGTGQLGGGGTLAERQGFGDLNITIEQLISDAPTAGELAEDLEREASFQLYSEAGSGEATSAGAGST
jgi:hypothetical protein